MAAFSRIWELVISLNRHEEDGGKVFRTASSVLRSYLCFRQEVLTTSAQKWPKAGWQNKKRNSCLPSHIPGSTIFSWSFFFFLKKYQQTGQNRNNETMSNIFMPFQIKELSKLRIDNTRQKMG